MQDTATSGSKTKAVTPKKKSEEEAKVNAAVENFMAVLNNEVHTREVLEQGSTHMKHMFVKETI